MKLLYSILLSAFVVFFISSCSSDETLEQTEDVYVETQTVPEPTYISGDNDIVLKYDSPALIDFALKNQKIDIVRTERCPAFNGCCLPRPLSEYNKGLFTTLYDISGPMAMNVNCEMWLNYKSDNGEIFGIPLNYNSARNNLEAKGAYFECIKGENEFWIPYFRYYHDGWTSETFDRVMDFAAPTAKQIKFRQQFCRSLPVATTLSSKYGKLFPLEITENSNYKVYSETPFQDITLEYRDINKGLNDFLDFYYLKNLDNLRDRFSNVAFLIRDTESKYPIEGAKVRITPEFNTEPGIDMKMLFSDFALRADNFDYGLNSFKHCASLQYLYNISMKGKLATYFDEYGVNPWAVINYPLVDYTNKDGEIFWTTENLVKEKYADYYTLLKTDLFRKSIIPKGHYYVMENNRNYRISIIHPRYQYFERIVTINGDSQIIIDMAQLTTKMETVEGLGNKPNIFIRRINLK